jgi:hypothetical protein
MSTAGALDGPAPRSVARPDLRRAASSFSMAVGFLALGTLCVDVLQKDLPTSTPSC